MRTNFLILVGVLALGWTEAAAAYIPRQGSTTLARRHRQRSTSGGGGECTTEGAWKCNGNQLTRCVFGKVVTVAVCSGPNIVCNDQGSTTGCIWGTVGSPSGGNPSGSPSGAPRPAPLPSGGSTLVSGPVPSPSGGAVVPSGGSQSNAAGLPSATLVPSASGGGAGAPSNTAVLPATTWVPGGSGGGNSTYGGVIKSAPAPHRVIYANRWLTQPPSPDALGGFNRFILSFYTSAGPQDLAMMWKDLPQNTKVATLEEYHAKGIALMVAAFGETDSSITKDPVATAKQMAQFVKDQMLDGLDIDYEDIEGMKSSRRDACVKWVIDFTTALRQELPPPYLISAAPLAPWYITSGPEIFKNTYNEISKAVGDKIDFFNIQYYNQGAGYDTCDQMLVKGDKYPGSAMLEISANTGVPLDKLVLGKPLGPAGYASNGYVDIDILKKCIEQGKSVGWSGGIMFWQWNAAEAPAVAQKLFS